MRRFYGTCIAICLLGTLNACASDRESGPASVARDSAGVVLVESRSAAWQDGAGWRVEPEPDVAIGLEDGDRDYLFGNVVGATRLANGVIVVADAQSGLLSYFDPAGIFLFARGGQGGGPGEMNRLAGVSTCGSGSVYAFDRGSRRAQVWSPEGDLEREFDLVEPSTQRTPYRYACGGGRIIANGWGDGSALGQMTKSQFHTQTAPVWILDSIGSRVSELGEFIQSERLFVANAQRTGGTSGPHPLGRSTVLAINDSNAYVGTSERFEVSLFGMDGKLKKIFRGPPGDSLLHPEFVDNYRSSDLDGKAAEDRRFVEMTDWLMPPQIPAYTVMLVDPAQNVWLRKFAAPWEQANAWAVFEHTGRYLGEVDVPMGLDVVEIGSDYLLAIAADSLGTQQVVRHRIVGDAGS